MGKLVAVGDDKVDVATLVGQALLDRLRELLDPFVTTTESRTEKKISAQANFCFLFYSVLNRHQILSMYCPSHLSFIHSPLIHSFSLPSFFFKLRGLRFEVVGIVEQDEEGQAFLGQLLAILKRDFPDQGAAQVLRPRLERLLVAQLARVFALVVLGLEHEPRPVRPGVRRTARKRTERGSEQESNAARNVLVLYEEVAIVAHGLRHVVVHGPCSVILVGKVGQHSPAVALLKRNVKRRKKRRTDEWKGEERGERDQARDSQAVDTLCGINGQVKARGRWEICNPWSS